MTYLASVQCGLDLFWDDMEPTQLLMLYGMMQRALDRTMKVEAMQGYPAHYWDLITDLMKLAGGAYGMLMHKCELISDHDEYVYYTGEIMGEKPSRVRRRHERELEGL